MQRSGQKSFVEMGYTGFPVRLEAFEGPLDLLVHLVRKKEVPLSEVPLAEICDQYMGYLREAKESQVEVTSAFIVMAATLLYLKSRNLLPQLAIEVDEEAEDDYERTRRTLLEQVANYERFSEVGNFLGARFEVFGRTYRRSAARYEPDTEYDLSRLSAQGLAEVLTEMLQGQIPREASVPEEAFSLTETVSEVRDLLKGHRGKLLFDDLLGARPTKVRVAAYFLALVHLIFMQQARAEQEAPFGPIEVMQRAGGTGGS